MICDKISTQKMHEFHPSGGIRLPATFSPTTSASLRAYVEACIEFLASPLVASLLECHPNDVAVHGPTSEWLNWWGWAARAPSQWHRLVPKWPANNEQAHPAEEIPFELMQMLNTIDSLALPRGSRSSSNLPSIRGMSPKKSHEVSEMSAYIASLISQSSFEIKHAVDVGAGQGYLSRALSGHPHNMDVLALDFSEIQISGAERRGRNIKKRSAKSNTVQQPIDAIAIPSRSATIQPTQGTVTHEMIHINPQTLADSTAKWISVNLASSPVAAPVLLVALHACGSLTPDILRCYVSCCRQRSSHSWYPAGLVIVGCCYNLMSMESDFPMSTTVSMETRKNNQNILLSYNHRSLAAQSPSQWSLNASSQSAAELAIRKVVYRAILAKQTALSTAHDPERYGKVGRLHDSAYASLYTFISYFNSKNNVEIPIPELEDVQELASCLEVLHALRCRIGPVVESLILVDRWLYLTEKLPAYEVLAINLFDQEKGSGRNIALVVQPQ